jgi:hypothetical protein
MCKIHYISTVIMYRDLAASAPGKVWLEKPPFFRPSNTVKLWVLLKR